MLDSSSSGQPWLVRSDVTDMVQVVRSDVFLVDSVVGPLPMPDLHSESCQKNGSAQTELDRSKFSQMALQMTLRTPPGGANWQE
jgi:hypothetical protein